MKTMTIDGLKVPNVSDEAEAAINKLQARIGDAEKDAHDAKARASMLDGEKAALQAQLDEARAAATPAALDKLVADRAALIVQAKSIKADIATDGKDAAAIRREIVASRIGDAASAMDEAGIAGAFAVLTADASKAVQNIAPDAAVTDAAAKEADALTKANDHNAWRRQV